MPMCEEVTRYIKTDDRKTELIIVMSDGRVKVVIEYVLPTRDSETFRQELIDSGYVVDDIFG